MRRILMAAVAAALLALGLAIGLAADNHDQGWPTTCVDLNDIVEAHLGNQGNVGIYQATFGDQAEAACRNDHRNDVRGTFAWAFAPLGASVATSFGAGTHLVGADIQPGTYRAQVTGAGCYWARLSGTSGTFQDIIANEFVTEGSTIVTIAATDKAFTSEGCGQWEPV